MDEYKKCIECGGQIPFISNLCSNCSSYQDKWRNELKFYSSIIAVLTFSFGAISLIISNLENVRKTLFWKENLSIIALNSEEYGSFVNSGDGDLYLHSIRFIETPSGRFKLDIGETIEAGDTIRVNIGKFRTAYLEKMQPENSDWRVANNDSIDRKKLESLGFSDLTFSNNEFCVYTSYTVDKDPILTLFNGSPRMPQTLTFPVTIVLDFYDVKNDEWKSSEEKGVGYYLINERCLPIAN